MISLALAWLMQAPAQQPKTTTLAAYLSSHPWDAAQKGPLVVLDPEHRLTTKEPKDLEAFGRKVLKIGDLSAIVPQSMVVIDDSLTQPPNMYEGLPEDSKVLYLLRSLSEEQWKAVDDAGIGLNDLQGEQKLVFRSLLPKPFNWSTYLADQNGQYGSKQAGATLTDEELQGVRLKVQRYVELQVFLDVGKSSSQIGAENFHALPGDSFSVHDYDGNSTETAFGVRLRSVVDNQPKAGSLNYADFKSKVKIPAGLTLKEVLPLVGSVVHRELIADVHVSNRPVVVVGEDVVTGDLLKALAACVTGTYRRVGPAYVLTSDLTGTGNRQFRVALWEDGLRKRVSDESDKWRSDIAKTAGFHAMTFGGGSLMTPPNSLVDAIDKGDSSHPVLVGTDKIGPGLNKLLDFWDSQYKTQPILKDQVGVSSSVCYSFVLPDGTQLHPEVQPLGGYWQFNQSFSERTPAAPPNVPIPFPTTLNLQLGVRVEKSDDLTRLIPKAVAHGFKKVWIECRDASTITRAIELGKAAHIEIGLLVSPWELPVNGSEVDLTIFGDHGSGVTQRTMQSRGWKQWLDLENLSPDRFHDYMSPGDPLVPDQWKKIATLTQISGLSGVMLEATQPPGYEPKRAGWHSALGPLEWGVVGHGFSEVQRLEFLRANGEDPIDLIDPEIFSTADLEQPFFPQPIGRGLDAEKLLAKWRTTVAAKNSEQILNLLTTIGHPTWVEMRPELVNTMPGPYGVFSKWRPGQTLPVGQGQQSVMFDPGGDGIISLPWPLETASSVATNRADWVRDIAKYHRPQTANIGIVIDFSAAPIGDVGSALDRWFAPPGR